MKRLSLKLKLTLLYTLFMVLIAVVFFSILFSLSNNEILAAVQGQLKNQVQESIDDIEEDDGSLDIDSDFFSLEDNIYLSVYDPDSYFLYGRIPQGFYEQPDFMDGELQTLRESKSTWYVYDLYYYIEDYGFVYIRGITSATQAENEFRITMRFAVILMPLLILITALLGYLMIRRALQPVQKLTDTVQEIQKDADLSRRIGLSKSPEEKQDEILHLASTFDEMLEKLEESFLREKQFTSDVSHELRTPVSVILAQCSTCLKDKTLTDTQREQILLIERKTKQISSLISQLLTLSRADQGRQQLTREYLNISELTEMTAAEQQILADQKHILIHCNIEPDICMWIDETFYIRMLINLISNAVYYGKDQGSIYISLRRQSGNVVGTVKDDGIGMSSEVLPHIWERFYRADSSRSDAARSGLGLSMVKWIAEAHGGHVTAESVPGQGSTFTFFLPE